MTSFHAMPLSQRIEKYLGQIPFLKQFGVTVSEAKSGQLRLEIKPNPKLTNHLGFYQAGVYFTLSEITGGLVFATIFDLDKIFLITKKSSIVFEAATSEGMTAVAKISDAEVQKIKDDLVVKKKMDVVLKVELFSSDNKRLTLTQHEYYLRLTRPTRLMRDADKV